MRTSGWIDVKANKCIFFNGTKNPIANAWFD